jgi:hypothetical protein
MHNFNPANGLPSNINSAGILYSQKIQNYTPPQNSPKTTLPKQKTGAGVEKKIPQIEYAFVEPKTWVCSYFEAKAGVSVETLHKYAVKVVKMLYNGPPLFHTIAYIQSNGIFRTKTPAASKDKKYRTHGKTANNEYCFGFDQLPTTPCNAILIVGGEDDALCINEHCNKSGIFAVSMNSEATAPSVEILLKLKEKSKRVLLCYDNDNTGITETLKQSEQLGIEYIDQNFLYGGIDANDICDLYKVCRGETPGQKSTVFCKLISTAIDSMASIKVDADLFSVPVHNVWQCTFNQYLTEQKPFDFLENAFASYPRIMLQSPAGTGKSYMQGLLAKAAISIGSKGCIVVTPTTAITESLTITIQKQFEGTKYSCTGLWGECAPRTFIDTNYHSVIVCTYDKLKTLLEYVNLDDYLLVVDEFHQLINDNSFRQKVCAEVMQIALSAKQCLLMSATPNYLLASEIVPQFNFKVLRFMPSITNSIEVQTIVHTDTKNGVLGMVEDFAPSGEGVHCIKLDNNAALEAYITKFDANDIEHLTSADRKKKEDNPIYQSIMNTGGLGLEKIRKSIVYTSLCEAGISFNFPVRCMSLIDVNSWSKFVQLCLRGRLQKDGTNEKIKANLFLAAPKKERTEFNKTAIEQFNKLFEDAKNAIKETNKQGGQLNGEQYKNSEDVNTYIKRNENGQYEVNLLAILYKLHDLENSSTTPENIQLRVLRVDPRFSFLPIKYLDDENRDIKDLLQASKEDIEQCNTAFIDLLQTNPANVFEAVYTKCKDPILKDSIKAALNVIAIPRANSFDFIENNAPAFATRLHYEAVKDVIKCIETGQSLEDAVKFYVSQGHKQVQIKTDLHNIAERKKSLKRGTLDKHEALQLKMHDAVQSKFKDYKDNSSKGKNTKLLTIKLVAELVNNAIQGVTSVPPLTERKAVEYLQRVFEIERKRDKKTSYYILKGYAK